MSKSTKLALIIDDIRSTHNVGSIFRSADCFGIAHIYICGYTPAPIYNDDPRLPHIANKLDKQIAKTALGASKTVPFTVHSSAKEVLAEARNDGYKIAVLEQTKNSTKLDDFTPDKPLAIIVGNELDGAKPWTIEASDVILEIEQYGTKESLNVANAASIAMYALRTAPNKK